MFIFLFRNVAWNDLKVKENAMTFISFQIYTTYLKRSKMFVVEFIFDVAQ